MYHRKVLIFDTPQLMQQTVGTLIIENLPRLHTQFGISQNNSGDDIAIFALSIFVSPSFFLTKKVQSWRRFAKTSPTIQNPLQH